MLDPRTSLAISCHAQPGALAILLGSGASLAAGVPTGWAIVTDLVRAIASQQGVDPGEEPAAWYRTRYGREPSYSELLRMLAPTTTERQLLLRRYFEPTDAERLQGIKSPTRAHRAIARLAQRGFVRLVITTNFDRLMERALADEGVQPQVIFSQDGVKGALPWVHAPCTVLKLHGDYLDSRLRNTEEELATYPAALSAYLRRALDEFGLIACGWSATWDPALRDAVRASANRRFSFFWAHLGGLTKEAEELTQARQAVRIATDSADELFEDLERRVQALTELNARHPVDRQLARFTVQRHVVTTDGRVVVRELARKEVPGALRTTRSDQLNPNKRFSEDEYRLEVRRATQATEVLATVVGFGSYWDNGPQNALWIEVLEALATETDNSGGLTVWMNLRRLPALLVLYALGIASAACGDYRALATLLERSVVLDRGMRGQLATLVSPYRVLDHQATNSAFFGKESKKTPISMVLEDALRSVLAELFIKPDGYEDSFDRFELLLAMHQYDRQATGRVSATFLGNFAWRHWRNDELSVRHRFAREIAGMGAEWPPLKAGLFDQDVARAEAALAAVDAACSRHPHW